jgi:ABC-type glycerol-3-phosphate transport system permease component
MKKAWINSICWIGFVLIRDLCASPSLGTTDFFYPNTELSLIPKHFTMRTLRNIFARPLFLFYLKNTLLVALGAIAVNYPIRMMGGYAWRGINFRGEKFELV